MDSLYSLKELAQIFQRDSYGAAFDLVQQRAAQFRQEVGCPALAFVGPSTSGKTSLMEACIGILSSCGLRVGAIKSHTKRQFTVDIPGKDSYRFTEAGSVSTLVSAPGKLALMKRLEHEPDFLELVSYMNDCDIVLAEGYRHNGLATIELVRRGVLDPYDSLAFTHISRQETLALASDFSSDELGEYHKAQQLITLPLNNPEYIASFIVQVFSLNKQA